MESIKFTLLVLVTIFCTGLSAQYERLVQEADYVHNTISFQHVDSICLSYSNGRYLNKYFGIGFDSSTVLAYTAGSYGPGDLYTQTFDANNNLLARTLQVWQTAGSTYVDTTLNTCTYDANNNLTVNLYQIWNIGGQNWVDNTKFLATYDANNNLTNNTEQTYDPNTNTLRNFANYLYTYNAANKVTQETWQVWDTLTTAWVNTANFLYTYDANNNNTQLLTQTWNSGTSSWINYGRILYSFNGTNQMDTQVGELWSAGLQLWFYESRYVFDYGTNTFDSLKLVQQYVVNRWVDSSQYVYAYDGFGNQYQATYIGYDTSTSTWVNIGRRTNTFDRASSITSYVTETWHPITNWQSTNGDLESFYYYEDYYPTGIASIPQANGKLSLYPTPASALLNIDITWDEQQPATIAIYDASGRLWRQWQAPAGASYQATVPLSSLPVGSYYMNVKGQSGELQRTFIVAR